MNKYMEVDLEKEKSKKQKRKKEIRRAIIGLSLGLVIGGSIRYKIEKENNFTRIVNENGDYELEGFISYDELAKYNVVEMETITGDTKVFIGKVRNSFYYKDIISDEMIYISSEKLISIIGIEDFLFAYDMIKGKYSEDDILELLDRIKDDYKNNENLKLVK